MNLRNNTSLSVALLFSLGALSNAANRVGTDRVPEDVKAQALVNYGKRPLSFEENRGQTDARVKFLSHGSDYSILLAPSEVSLNLRPAGRTRRQSAIRMSFPGANSSPAMAGGERQSGTSSYFFGNDPAKWVAGAPNFARVHYREIYPGVDLAFYGNQGKLEYDFVVAPGADPGAIRLQFDGVDGMHLDGAGNLVLSAASGEIRQHKPIVYQEGAGGRQAVEGRYVIQARNRVEFEIAGYDKRRALVIDPVLTFSTYLGSPGDELYSVSAAASTATYPAVAVDLSGNVYVAGYNGGGTFAGQPVTPLAGVHSYVFVVKMNPAGTNLLYSVFFAGSGADVAGGIAVDASGNAYVTGSTTSNNFPTVNPPQATFYGNSSNPNAFATEVNAAGNALVYSTYLGGSGSFWGRGIAVDHSGNAYVTGTASASGSTPFCTVCSLSSTPSAGFLAEVSAGGGTFAYSTYLPAGIGYGIAVDSTGAAYVTGSTAPTPSPAQGYVLKVNAGGTSVGYGPVLLGSTSTTATLQTIGFGIALDAQNDAYVTGMTNDPNLPQVTSSAPQTKYGGGLTDGFALKLNSSGGLVYGTYIGGLGSNILPERGSGIGVDAAGNAYVSGTTQCLGVFPTGNPISGARNGGPAVLMQGAISGSTSTWSPTTLTGSFDQVTALAFDSSGNLYAGASALNATGGGVYKLASGGTTWAATGPLANGSSVVTTTTVDSIAVDPIVASTVYAAGSGNLYQSTNSGASWAQLSQAVGTSAAIAVGKATSTTSTVYVGSSSGLTYSTNGGPWTAPITPAPGAVIAIVADPNNLLTAYAGTPTGVYQTTNGGGTWAPVNTGLPTLGGTTMPATSLAIYAGTPAIYAATPNGLYYATNAATVGWTNVALGHVLSTPSLVAVDSGNNVYVAFEGSGMVTGTGGGLALADWSALTYNGLTQNQIVALAAPLTGPGGTAYAGIVSAPTAFLTEISPNGESFLSSTCIGGSDNNLGQNIAVTPGGSVLVSGATIATNFPTLNAVQPANAGLWDDFVMGIALSQGQVDSPSPGITLSDGSADFSWNAVTGATQYQLLVGTTPGGSDIFGGTTAGTSQFVGSIPCSDTVGGTIYVQLAADVNGYQPPIDYTYKCKSGLGDFNGDGYQDVLWQNNSTHQVSVHYFDGTQGATYIGWNWLNSKGEPSGWVLVGAADFDGNGVPDLVWEYMPTGQVTVNYYGGLGGATLLGWNWLNKTGNPGWTVVAVADMNGDGVPDLIWEKNATNQVTVNYYGGPGGATLTGWNWLNSAGEPAGWHVVAAADFDGNGTPDLVWQYAPTRQVTVNYYGGTGGATYQGWNWLNSTGDPGWTVVGANDFNGDGVPDLVWQNDTTAQVTVNYYGGSKGATLIGWNWLATPGYPGWTAVVPR